MSSPWFKTDNKHSCVLNDALTAYLKRAVSKDAGEDGSGQHGDDGQDHRHAVCGGRDEEIIGVKEILTKLNFNLRDE